MLFMSISPWIIPLSLLVIFEAIADILAKEWQINGGVLRASAALVAYLIANSFWLFALKNGSGLARGGMIFALACAILAIVIGLWMYREPITKIQALGMSLGILSLCLIFWEN